MKRILRNFLIFIGTGLVVVPFLIGGTIISELDAIWHEEGRAYDTKWEYFTANFIGHAYNNNLKKDVSPERVDMRIMDAAVQWAYRSALTKIPENDWERIEWFYLVEYKKLITKPEGDSLIQSKFLQLITSLIHNEEYKNFSIQSRYIANIGIHKIMSEFYGYLYLNVYANKNYKHKKYWPEIMHMMHYFYIRIDEKYFKNNSITSNRESYAEILNTHYKILYSSIFNQSKECNFSYANWWLEISDRVQLTLLQSPEQPAQYLKDKDDWQLFKEFKTFYERADNSMRKNIHMLCK